MPGAVSVDEDGRGLRPARSAEVPTTEVSPGDLSSAGGGTPTPVVAANWTEPPNGRDPAAFLTNAPSPIPPRISCLGSRSTNQSPVWRDDAPPGPRAIARSGQRSPMLRRPRRTQEWTGDEGEPRPSRRFAASRVGSRSEPIPTTGAGRPIPPRRGSPGHTGAWDARGGVRHRPRAGTRRSRPTVGPRHDQPRFCGGHSPSPRCSSRRAVGDQRPRAGGGDDGCLEVARCRVLREGQREGLPPGKRWSASRRASPAPWRRLWVGVPRCPLI